MVRFFLLLLLYINFACTTTRNYKDLISLRTASNQSININLNGFYYSQNLISADDEDLISINVLLLYKNGLVINDGEYTGKSRDYCTNVSNAKNDLANALINYKSRLKMLHNNKFSSCKINMNDIDGKGLFLVTKDSITIQYFKAEAKNKDKYSTNDYFLYEYKGVVINDETFKIISIKNFDKNEKNAVDIIYKFNLDENLPTSDHTLFN